MFKRPTTCYTCVCFYLKPTGALTVQLKKFLDFFSKQEIVFCYTILEQNKRLLLPTAVTPTSSATINQVSILETVFPFDPYHLKRFVCLYVCMYCTTITGIRSRSRKFITDLYQEWEGEEQEEEKVFTCTCIYVPIYMYMYMYMHVHNYIYTCISYTCTYIHVHVHVYIWKKNCTIAVELN